MFCLGMSSFQFQSKQEHAEKKDWVHHVALSKHQGVS